MTMLDEMVLAAGGSNAPESLPSGSDAPPPMDEPGAGTAPPAESVAPLPSPEADALATLRAELEATKSDAAESKRVIDEWRKQAQQATQTQAAQSDQEHLDRMVAIARKAAIGMEATEEEVIREAMVEHAPIGRKVMSPEFKAQMREYDTWVHGRHVNALSWELAEKHLGPQTTAARMQEFRKELITLGNPAMMESYAARLAGVWKANNARERVASGAERVEGSGRFAGGGLGDQVFVDRWADPNGGIPSTAENVQRARKLTEMGFLARAR